MNQNNPLTCGTMLFMYYFLAAVGLAQWTSTQADVEMRFEPSPNFTQSLPSGNSRLGGMVFGQTNNVRIVLNEISM